MTKGSNMSRRDLVIVGAPRSGTNMLRDVLVTLPGFSTWPCDEINYIWRHGNARFPSDELTPDMVTDRSRRYIRRAFDRLARKDRADVVVEKTCANTLRVAYVESVLDQPFYVNIVRDGLDAVGSARLRWTADLDVGYLAAKTRYVPASDLPVYAAKYGVARVRRLLSRERAMPSWGPRLHDMDRIVSEHDLNEVCAIQWQRCVDSSARDLARIDQGRVVNLRYETFVRNPSEGVAEILDQLGRTVSTNDLAVATGRVRASSVGKGRAQLGDQEAERIRHLMEPTLAQHGYS